MSLEKQIHNAQQLNLNSDIKDSITERNLSETENENKLMNYEV